VAILSLSVTSKEIQMMSADNTDEVGSLQHEEVPLEAAAERARVGLDEAVRSLWDVYSAAESVARQTLTDAETSLQQQQLALRSTSADLEKRSAHLEATFDEANRLLKAADHQHRVADDRIRDADRTTERAAETLASALDQSERVLAQAAARAMEIEQTAYSSTESASEAAKSIVAVAEEDANAILAQAQQRADKILGDAERAAEKTMDGARIYKNLQLAELEAKEVASRERLRELMQSIESTLRPRDHEQSIDLRSDGGDLTPADLVDTDGLSDDSATAPADDAGVNAMGNDMVDNAVRKAFDQWASEGSAG